MCRHSIIFLYNPGHVILWCLEVVPVAMLGNVQCKNSTELGYSVILHYFCLYVILLLQLTSLIFKTTFCGISPLFVCEWYHYNHVLFWFLRQYYVTFALFAVCEWLYYKHLFIRFVHLYSVALHYFCLWVTLLLPLLLFLQLYSVALQYLLFMRDNWWCPIIGS